jgi:hypothetical protein
VKDDGRMLFGDKIDGRGEVQPCRVESADVMGSRHDVIGRLQDGYRARAHLPLLDGPLFPFLDPFFPPRGGFEA